MERALIEYLLNSLWQVPLLAGGAWLLLRLVKPKPWIQHWIWLAVLAMAVVLPAHGANGLKSGVARESSSSIVVPAYPTMSVGAIRVPLESSAQRVLRCLEETVVGIRAIRLSAIITNWLAGLYLVIVAFGLLRFVQSWLAAQRLAATSRETTLPPEGADALKNYSRKIGAKLPQLRESSEVQGPLIVGAATPILILPANFIHHTEDEIRAALFHELAHVRRQDYLVNLLCRIAALPVAWHPATYAIQKRISGTREMACDAMAAEEMRSEGVYARCLVALARGIFGGDGVSSRTQALGLFDGNILEERVMRLMESKRVMSVRAKLVRLASGVAAMAAATIMATMFHVTPTIAEAQASNPSPAVAQSVPATQENKSAASASERLPSWPTGIVNGREAATATVVVTEKPGGYFSLGPDGSGGTKVVMMRKGFYVHLWKAADGEPFLIVNRVRQKPTPEEKRRIEKEFTDPRKQVDEANKLLNSSEFKQQMKLLNSPESKQRMSDLLKMKDELKTLQNSEIDQQVTAQLNSIEFKQQIMEVQKEIQNGQMKAELRFGQMQKDFHTLLRNTQTK